MTIEIQLKLTGLRIKGKNIMKILILNNLICNEVWNEG